MDQVNTQQLMGFIQLFASLFTRQLGQKQLYFNLLIQRLFFLASSSAFQFLLQVVYAIKIFQLKIFCFFQNCFLCKKILSLHYLRLRMYYQITYKYQLLYCY
ncbi:transmembrane protein, putative (macronuclear) [Tetrahymena thermophila SB210]|uniref:Transmembrane protein, putative n=1 Tax=Tetrahymena thermophila (strain SB210) TaxID=312017 RepID=W7XI76_TETTS|nr:transmembrane protein, putative [Tetrahymena thermophila SB210]EWS73069.1 transmembrane protein, putative [Tetrahymena thermophila SB210]|eukprot:XP_012654378.1 transmembrane protein, putative [Tetrahymena thermophila SB210]